MTAHQTDASRKRELAETAARRASQLQEATSALAAALTPAAVSATFLAAVEDVFGAVAGVVYLYGERGELHLVAGRGVPELDDRLRVLTTETRLPLVDAARAREPIWF